MQTLPHDVLLKQAELLNLQCNNDKAKGLAIEMALERIRDNSGNVSFKFWLQGSPMIEILDLPLCELDGFVIKQQLADFLDEYFDLVNQRLFINGSKLETIRRQLKALGEDPGPAGGSPEGSE